MRKKNKKQKQKQKKGINSKIRTILRENNALVKKKRQGPHTLGSYIGVAVFIC